MKVTSLFFVRQTALSVCLFFACLTFRAAAQSPATSNAVPTVSPQEWDRFRQTTEGQNAAIKFYGRVIDQDGNPLSNIDVRLRVQQVEFDPRYFVVPKYIRFNRTTDPNGNFVLVGVSGRAVDIESITKPGYVLEKDINPVYGAVAGTSEKPVTLVLWKTGYVSPLIEGQENFTFVPDGRFYSVSLTNRMISDATNISGDFKFRLLRKSGMRKWDRFDWSFDIHGENGNVLQQTDERYDEMLFSPADSFTNSYEYGRRATDSSWRRSGRLQFYIRFSNSLNYGKISLVWDAAPGNDPKKNEAGIQIRYTVNPTGSPLVR